MLYCYRSKANLIFLNLIFLTDRNMFALALLLHNPLYLIILFRKALCLDHNGLLSTLNLSVISYAAITWIISCLCWWHATLFIIQLIPTTRKLRIAILELCINEIRQWMKSNFLKLNDEKTEFMLSGSHQQLSKINIDCIHIGDSSIASASRCKNIGSPP